MLNTTPAAGISVLLRHSCSYTADFWIFRRIPLFKKDFFICQWMNFIIIIKMGNVFDLQAMPNLWRVSFCYMGAILWAIINHTGKTYLFYKIRTCSVTYPLDKYWRRSDDSKPTCTLKPSYCVRKWLLQYSLKSRNINIGSVLVKYMLHNYIFSN